MSTNNKIGKFITVEGIDGGGKSTFAKELSEYLENKGHQVVLTREPGGVKVCEEIRAVILNNEMNGFTETLLFNAARNELIVKVIMPALREGKIVISDRFHDSTYVYQGAKGFYHEASKLEAMVVNENEIVPDKTLFFDLTVEESNKRIEAGRNGDKSKFEKNQEYRKLVYNYYQVRFKQNPNRMVRIDAMHDMARVRKQVFDWADKYFD